MFLFYFPVVPDNPLFSTEEECMELRKNGFTPKKRKKVKSFFCFGFMQVYTFPCSLIDLPKSTDLNLEIFWLNP